MLHTINLVALSCLLHFEFAAIVRAVVRLIFAAAVRERRGGAEGVREAYRASAKPKADAVTADEEGGRTPKSSTEEWLKNYLCSL
jgi:hypothetical protein